MWLEIILGIVATEALVQLWFYAAPLQWLRGFLVSSTPFLFSAKQNTHLLNCQYCVSVWIGFLVSIIYFTTDFYIYIVMPLTVHRLSNFLHLVFSLIKDKQIDLRVSRNRNKY